jgi:hypothetical protein
VGHVVLRARRAGVACADLLTLTQVLTEAGTIDLPATTAADVLIAAYEAVPYLVLRGARERLPRLHAHRLARWLDNAITQVPLSTLADVLVAVGPALTQLAKLAEALVTPGAPITPAMLVITVNGSIGPRELDGIVPVGVPAVGENSAHTEAETKPAPRVRVVEVG